MHIQADEAWNIISKVILKSYFKLESSFTPLFNYLYDESFIFLQM
jgi:hypothetical protein